MRWARLSAGRSPPQPQGLERHGALELGVPAAEDGAHAAGGQQLDDLVAAEEDVVERPPFVEAAAERLEAPAEVVDLVPSGGRRSGLGELPLLAGEVADRPHHGGPGHGQQEGDQQQGRRQRQGRLPPQPRRHRLGDPRRLARQHRPPRRRHRRIGAEDLLAAAAVEAAGARHPAGQGGVDQALREGGERAGIAHHHPAAVVGHGELGLAPQLLGIDDPGERRAAADQDEGADPGGEGRRDADERRAGSRGSGGSGQGLDRPAGHRPQRPRDVGRGPLELRPHHLLAGGVDHRHRLDAEVGPRLEAAGEELLGGRRARIGERAVGRRAAGERQAGVEEGFDPRRRRARRQSVGVEHLVEQGFAVDPHQPEVGDGEGE